jgi:protein-S-isoprenylcysteine O-methyltransferase Ste14
MNKIVIISCAVLLTVAAYVVFHILVRRDYQKKGQLSLFTSLLELLIFVLYLAFPYFYNPPEWAWFWLPNPQVSQVQWAIALVSIVAGMAIAFGTMAWFGIRRAFGLQVTTLMQTGPYRFSRNPQIVGGALMVLGIALLWPHWYAVMWAVLYFWIGHLMVLTEEEHLAQVFGEEYKAYCAKVPRYLSF